MDIETWALADCNPAPYNPRKDLQPGDPEYDRLKKSMQEFDYVDPIIVNRRTARIVGGHQRYKVLRDLGYTEAQVSVVDLDEPHEKALNVALNKQGGAWDDAKLADLLEDLTASLDDIEVTGFGADDIAQWLSAPMMGSLADLDGYGTKDVEQLTLIVHLGEADPFRQRLKAIAEADPDPDDLAPMGFALSHALTAYDRQK